MVIIIIIIIYLFIYLFILIMIYTMFLYIIMKRYNLVFLNKKIKGFQKQIVYLY